MYYCQAEIVMTVRVEVRVKVRVRVEARVNVRLNVRIRRIATERRMSREQHH